MRPPGDAVWPCTIYLNNVVSINSYIYLKTRRNQMKGSKNIVFNLVVEEISNAIYSITIYSKLSQKLSNWPSGGKPLKPLNMTVIFDNNGWQ
jgi:hypothetical protein